VPRLWRSRQPRSRTRSSSSPQDLLLDPVPQTKRAHEGLECPLGDFSPYSDYSAAPSNSLKLLADNSWKSRSRVGFWHGDSAYDAALWCSVINIEVFGREWRPITSPDGVACEVSVLRQRALRVQPVSGEVTDKVVR
jgi:hypothetical protein